MKTHFGWTFVWLSLVAESHKAYICFRLHLCKSLLKNIHKCTWQICLERVIKNLFSKFSIYFSCVCIQDKYYFYMTRNSTKCNHYEKQETLPKPYVWAFTIDAVTAGAVSSELSGWEQAQWGFNLTVILQYCCNIYISYWWKERCHFL